MAANKFVIVGTQRTGTTLIRTCLDSHSGIRCIGEAFKVSRKWGNYECSLGYHKYRSASLSRWLRHWIARRGLVSDYLEQLFALAGYDAVGFKFMHTHTARFPSVIPYIRENGVRVIHVVRDNVLKTYVSRLAARERRLAYSNEKVPLTRVSVPLDELLSKLEMITRQQQEWSEIFADHGAYLQLSYEAFVGNQREEIARLLAHIGVEYEELRSPLVKLNPDSLSQIVVNFPEVRERLTGTLFERCLA